MMDAPGDASMSQFVTATFEDGVLKPHANLDLAVGTEVRLIVTPCVANDGEDALDELDRLCDQEPIHAGGERLTRDQLHERP
jgi:predicted DNA-binding antitoxin AbrB/MazE fold protein